MHTVYEQMARLHAHERLAEAEQQRRAARVVAARRASRRAEAAAARASRLRAIALAC